MNGQGEVAAISELQQKLQSQMAKNYREALASARGDDAAARGQKRQRRHGEKTAISTSAQSCAILRSRQPIKTRMGASTGLPFVASPHVAGLYVEGGYAIGLPVTATFLAGLKPAYRRSFELQRQ